MKLTKKGNVRVTLTFHSMNNSFPEVNRCVLCVRNGNSTLIEGFSRNREGTNVLECDDGSIDIDMCNFSHWAYTENVSSYRMWNATRKSGDKQ